MKPVGLSLEILFHIFIIKRALLRYRIPMRFTIAFPTHRKPELEDITVQVREFEGPRAKCEVLVTLI